MYTDAPVHMPCTRAFYAIQALCFAERAVDADDEFARANERTRLRLSGRSAHAERYEGITAQYMSRVRAW